MDRVRFVSPFLEKNTELIADGEEIPGSEYLLRFKDEQGNVIGYF